MEKIIIRCNTEFLQYTFPKRKWYQIMQFNRIALMRLDFCGEDTLETDIGLEIYENSYREPARIIEDSFLDKLYMAILAHYREAYHDAEHLILLDHKGEVPAELVYVLADNRNYLSVCTDNPQKYEMAAFGIERDYGLVPMFFQGEKELLRYVKQMPDKQILLVDANGLPKTKSDKWRTSLLCCLPPKSFLLDFSPDGICRELVFKKRLKITYASIPIFLDNIVKNRYNSVVNEGITFQVKQDKKQVWRRKGNEDGRKEKYPDL